jgi:transposase-like protein
VERITTLSLMERIPDEPSAWEYLEQLRWNGKPVCPHCGNDEKSYFLNPRNGHRETSTGKATFRRLWKCAACRKPFSVLTDTVMHGSKIPVRTWIMVLFEMASNKNGVAAYEVCRRYGLTNKSAWFLLHRIREAMKANPLDLLGGNGAVVVADETFIGGKPRNRHQQGRPVRLPEGGRGRAGSATKKTPVLSLIDRRTGEVRSRVVADVSGATLRKVMSEQVDMAGSILHTDGGTQYRDMGTEFIAHEFVDHSAYEYVRYTDERVVTSNQAENFFSQLKRSIDGTHHHVSVKHLNRYLGEFDFRYSTKKASDTERMRWMVDQAAGRRLTYRPLIAR